MIEITTPGHREGKKDALPVMLDNETLGTGMNSAIIAIGACEFDPDTGEIGRTFHAVLSRQSCLDLGCTEDDSTLEWWSKQSMEARLASFDHEAPTDAKVALLAFKEWLRNGATVWGNGADFDNAMLAELYRKAGYKDNPWKFWNNRCYRTMKNMFPQVSMSRHGTHHNALDDAISQAKHLCKILARMRNMQAALG